MQTLGIQHVTVGVRELDEAIAFYELFGLTRVLSRPDFGIDGAWMQAADQQVHIVVTGDRPAPDAATHFAFIVEDLDACLAELDIAGVTYRRPQRFAGAGSQAFIKDPTGNVVELNQPD